MNKDKIENVQDLLTWLGTMDATASRRFTVSADNVLARTAHLRTMVADNSTLTDIRAEAIDMKGWAFIGGAAGMKWLDTAWDRLVAAFPLPVEEAELAAHLTASLIEANG